MNYDLFSNYDTLATNTYVKLRDVIPSSHPEFLAAEPDNTLIQSIVAQGIVVPVLLCEYEGKLFPVDGKRRIKALRYAAEQDVFIMGKIDPEEYQIPAIVLDISLDKAMFIAAIAQHNRSDNPLTDADTVMRAADYLGLDIHNLKPDDLVKISRTLHWGVQQVNKAVRLIVPPEITAAAAEGKISKSAVRAISKLREKDQQRVIEAIKHGDTVSATNVADIVRNDKIARARQVSMLRPAFVQSKSLVEEYLSLLEAYHARCSSGVILDDCPECKRFVEVYERWQQK
jgi:ParB-like chromosome segregation protein Spo0J